MDASIPLRRGDGEVPGGLREKILDEAIGIVYRQGVDRVTMRGLAENLGYSPATIYLYFKNKKDLIRQIAVHGFERLYEATRPALDVGDPCEAVIEVGRRYIDFGVSNNELYRLMFQDFSVQDYAASNRERGREIWYLYRELYARGSQAGVFADMPSAVQIAIGWAAVHGFVQLAQSGRLPAQQSDGGAFVAIRDALLEAQVRALRA